MEIASEIKVAPAIYELVGSHWGWYKIKELTEVVNDLFKLQGYKINLEPMELVKSFRDLACMSNGPYLLYCADCEELKWFNDHKHLSGFTDDYFAPVGWGMDVIKAVRLGAIKVFDKLNHDKKEVWGEKEDSTTFRIKF
jgi:hypothetical protein